MNYRSIAVPVQATQWFKDGDHNLVYPIFDGFNIQWYELSNSSGSTEVDSGDWIVEFPNGEVHVVRDKHFKQRFQETTKFTKQELSYVSRLASMGDCT